MSTEIILCEKCAGFGRIERRECTDYHNNCYDIYFDLCQECGGYGRLIKITENLAIVEKNQIRNISIKIKRFDNIDCLIGKYERGSAVKG